MSMEDNDPMPYLRFEIQHLGKKFCAALMARNSEIDVALQEAFTTLSNSGRLQSIFAKATEEMLAKAIARAAESYDVTEALKVIILRSLNGSPAEDPSLVQPSGADGPAKPGPVVPGKRRRETKDHISGCALCQEAMQYLNDKTGRRFRGSDLTVSALHARIATYGVEKVREVIDRKVAAWGGSPKWSRYLRPETLFNATKFDGYANESGPMDTADMPAATLPSLEDM